MQTFLLKIDDAYINSLLEFIKPIPKENYEFKRVDLESDINISLIDDEISYQKALIDLEKGDAIKLEDYMTKRGLS